MGINTFISNFKGGARPNRYKVHIEFPSIGNIIPMTDNDHIYVSAAGLPASMVNSVPVPYMGRQIPVLGDRTFEDWTVTVLNDVNFKIRNNFEIWSNAILAHQANFQNTAVEGWRDLIKTVDIYQLDRTAGAGPIVGGGDVAPVVLKHVKLLNAFPTMISQIDLGFDQNDSIEMFTVTFAYSHWEAEGGVNNALTTN